MNLTHGCRRRRRSSPALLLLLGACAAVPPRSADWLTARWRRCGDTRCDASLRGLSATSARTCWASGTGGIVLRTTDGGANWQRVGPTAAATLDLRSLRAFDDDTAWVANAGAPARLFVTRDGGRQWTLVYEDLRPEAFFDAIAAWDRERGLVVGDPQAGRFVMLRTLDGGSHWTAPAPQLPVAAEGEAAFAAGGGCVTALGLDHAWLATGGTRARVLRTVDQGRTWQPATLPLRQGAASMGAFAVAFADPRRGVVVGGDYQARDDNEGTAACTSDGGATWVSAPTGAGGFRSAVGFLPGGGRIAIAVGDGGTSVSTDGGVHWQVLSGHEGYHALSIATDGSVWGAGSGGRIARLEPGVGH